MNSVGILWPAMPLTSPSFSSARSVRIQAMSMEPTTHDFDPDAVAAALCGTWRFLHPGPPAGIGLLHFTDAGRAIQFLFDPQQPEKRIPMRLRYSVESPTHLRFRPSPNHEGHLRHFRFDGRTMTLGAESQRWVCTRPSPDEIPEWFHPSLATALTRL